MDYYDQDEILNDIHDEMYREEEQRPSNKGFNAMSESTKFVVGIAALTIVIFMIIGKLKVTTGLLILAAGIIFILYLTNSKEQERKELTMIEIMIRVKEQLKFLQQHKIGDFANVPEGKIDIQIIGRKQWYEGKPWKRSLGIRFYDNNWETYEQLFLEADCYTGDIITVKKAPQGVDGEETKDLKYIATPGDRMEKTRNKFLGGGRKKR